MNEEYIKGIIQKTDLCCPSDDFVNNIMNKCCAVPTKVPFKVWCKNVAPWAAMFLISTLITILIVFFGVSLEPSFINSILTTVGLGFMNILYTIKLTSIGIVLGILSISALILNKYKQKLITV